MKILSVKKKTLLVIAVVAVLAVAVLTVSLVSAASAAVTPNGKTVVIDPGHGGRDGGVVGTTSGKKESDINLAIAKSLKHFLTEAGYRVVMTRETDEDLATSGASFKKSDMAARKKIIEEAGADLVVSIHQNSYPRKDVHGAQVFYAPSSEIGKAYADKMQSVLNDSLSSDRAAKSADYYILQCTEVPSVLVECGFLSNPAEESLLLTEDYRQKVAYTLCTGVRLLLEDGVPLPQKI